jgi:sulfonate transport system permease protein
MTMAAPYRLRPRRLKLWPAGRARGWLLVLALLLIWEISGRELNFQSWPPFSVVLAALVSGLASGKLLSIWLASLYRMAVGYAAGCACGVVAGVVLGAQPRLAAAFSPLLEGLRPLPIPAIVPPLILFFGIDDELKIVVVATAVFFPVLVNTLSGVQQVERTFIDTARTFGKSRAYVLLRVMAPAALPSIMAGLRISISLALVTTIVAEMIAGSGGIGYYIIETQYAMHPDQMYAAVICLALTGYGLNRLFVLAEDRLVRSYRLGDRVAG